MLGVITMDLNDFITVAEAQALIQEISGKAISVGRVRQLISGTKREEPILKATKRGNTNLVYRPDVIEYANQRKSQD